MTPEQAFNQVIDQQIGSACRTIAQQAAAAAEMQNQIEALKKEIEEFKKPRNTLESVK